MKGRNLVIQGPPGTGKSQTIANIVANGLGADKTILFVAEKQAALEVVKRRLERAGLGEFCLELHSDKASPKMVLESLQKRLKTALVGAPAPQGASWHTNRKEIAKYLEALHSPRPGDTRPSISSGERCAAPPAYLKSSTPSEASRYPRSCWLAPACSPRRWPVFRCSRDQAKNSFGLSDIARASHSPTAVVLPRPPGATRQPTEEDASASQASSSSRQADLSTDSFESRAGRFSIWSSIRKIIGPWRRDNNQEKISNIVSTIPRVSIGSRLFALRACRDSARRPIRTIGCGSAEELRSGRRRRVEVVPSCHH